jgi:hypothetical protein
VTVHHQNLWVELWSKCELGPFPQVINVLPLWLIFSGKTLLGVQSSITFEGDNSEAIPFFNTHFYHFHNQLLPPQLDLGSKGFVDDHG